VKTREGVMTADHLTNEITDMADHYGDAEVTFVSLYSSSINDNTIARLGTC
jgi:hypothetical protein